MLKAFSKIFNPAVNAGIQSRPAAESKTSTIPSIPESSNVGDHQAFLSDNLGYSFEKSVPQDDAQDLEKHILIKRTQAQMALLLAAVENSGTDLPMTGNELVYYLEAMTEELDRLAVLFDGGVEA